jgi:hypothetical protein
LCFFCVLEDTFELNWPIMACGFGGMLPPRSPEGGGRVREGKSSSEFEL